MNNRRFLPYIILGIIALFVIMGISSSIFYTIGNSERAIIFYKFGNGLDKEQGHRSGFSYEGSMERTLCVYHKRNNSLMKQWMCWIKAVFLFTLMLPSAIIQCPTRLAISTKSFIPTSTEDYIGKLVIPEVRSTVRQVMGRYTAEEIYSTKRAEVETAIRTETEKILQHEFCECPCGPHPVYCLARTN